MLVKWRLQ